MTIAGPACAAAAWPVSTKMPVPMIAPMPSDTRLAGPSTRFSPPPCSLAGERLDGLRPEERHARQRSDRERRLTMPVDPIRCAGETGGWRREHGGAPAEPVRRQDAIDQPVGTVGGDDRRRVGEPGAQGMDVPRRQVRDLGALGPGLGKALADLGHRNPRPAADTVGNQLLPGEPLVRAGAERHRGVEQPSAQLDPAADFPLDEIEPVLDLAPRFLVVPATRPRHGAAGSGQLERESLVDVPGDRRHDHLLELPLVHHLARVEAGVEQVAPEGRRVAALVRHEADGRLPPREHAAHRRGHVDRLPPAVGGNAAESGKVHVLQQHTAREQQRGHHPRERRDLGELRGIDGEQPRRVLGREVARIDARRDLDPSNRWSQPATAAVVSAPGSSIAQTVVDHSIAGAVRAMVSSSSAVWYK